MVRNINNLLLFSFLLILSISLIHSENIGGYVDTPFNVSLGGDGCDLVYVEIFPGTPSVSDEINCTGEYIHDTLESTTLYFSWSIEGETVYETAELCDNNTECISTYPYSITEEIELTCNVSMIECDLIVSENVDVIFPDEICDNGIDDDGDGNADCADSECFETDYCLCYEDTGACSRDGFSYSDGGTDCYTDDSCWCKYAAIEICDDGCDNNGDGYADGLDSNCGLIVGCRVNTTACTTPGLSYYDGTGCHIDWECTCDFSSIEVCNDGYDNDCDGDIDCADPDCTGTFTCPCDIDLSVCPHPASGYTDGTDCYTDGTCACVYSVTELCYDGCDNDGDGAVDCCDDECSCGPDESCNGDCECVDDPDPCDVSCEPNSDDLTYYKTCGGGDCYTDSSCTTVCSSPSGCEYVAGCTEGNCYTDLSGEVFSNSGCTCKLGVAECSTPGCNYSLGLDSAYCYSDAECTDECSLPAFTGILEYTCSDDSETNAIDFQYTSITTYDGESLFGHITILDSMEESVAFFEDIPTAPGESAKFTFDEETNGFGNYTMILAVEGYVSWVEEFTFSLDEVNDVCSHNRTVIYLHNKECADNTLSFHIEDDEGDFIEGVEVELQEIYYLGEFGSSSIGLIATTDADGNVVFGPDSFESDREVSSVLIHVDHDGFNLDYLINCDCAVAGGNCREDTDCCDPSLYCLGSTCRVDITDCCTNPSACGEDSSCNMTSCTCYRDGSDPIDPDDPNDPTNPNGPGGAGSPDGNNTIITLDGSLPLFGTTFNESDTSGVFNEKLELRNGCSGLFFRIDNYIFCDLLWVVMLILSILASWTWRRHTREHSDNEEYDEDNETSPAFRIIPILMFIIPVLLGFLSFIWIGVLIAVIELLSRFSIFRRVRNFDEFDPEDYEDDTIVDNNVKKKQVPKPKQKETPKQQVKKETIKQVNKPNSTDKSKPIKNDGKPSSMPSSKLGKR